MIGVGFRLRLLALELQRQAQDKLRIAAIYDPDPLSVKEALKCLGQNIQVCESEQQLIDHPDIEWVFIGSWNCFHARQAIDALKAGKQVFCEKPLATSLEDCLAMRQAVQNSGRTFALGLVLRYSPHYARIHEILSSGVLGKLVSFEFNETLSPGHGGYIFGNWRRLQQNAGSHLLEKCCHDIDLANWLIGSLPTRGASFGGKQIFTPENAGLEEESRKRRGGNSVYESFSDPRHVESFGAEHDIFDNQVAILEYANGVRATFHTNAHSALPERRMYINGVRGTLRADLLQGRIELARIDRGGSPEVIATTSGDMHGDADAVMASGLLRTMFNEEPPLASIHEGICSAVTAFGLDQAADSGTVTDYTSLWQKAGILL